MEKLMRFNKNSKKRDKSAKKAGIIFCLAIAFVFSFISLGRGASMYEQNSVLRQEDSQEKNWTNVENIANKEIPYLAPVEKTQGIGKEFSENSKETVLGLKNAGYTTEEIIATLKNDGKNALEISIACLNADLNGKEIHAALIKSGFSQVVADFAIPASLRQEAVMGQINPAIISTGDNKNNMVEQKNAISNNFVGLGDWNNFQNNRFDFLKGEKK